MSQVLRPNSETFGLIAWLKETRVRLPLRGIDVRFEVNDTVADVHVDQVFSNDHDEALDVTYTFPLPAAAAVYRCEMIVDGRVIAAVVEEEQEAKRQFVEAKAAGFKAALVEQHRDNVFSLQLGNVPGRSVVVLRISYLQELERLVDTVSLRIPTCPGVRYIPGQPLLRSNRGPGIVDDTDQVPDASLISPPRIDALHPDAASLSVRGRLIAREVNVGSFLSPSHPLMAHAKGEVIDVSLAMDSALPDQDVMIRWTPRALDFDSVFSTTATFQGYHTALSRLKSPDLAVDRRGPREIWFLIDRSGSMEGRNWEQSCRALHEALGHLHPDDRVGLSFFESSVQHFSDRAEKVSNLRSDPKLRDIVRLGTTGGTEMLPALQEVIRRWNPARSSSTEQHLVIITDGQVGNDDAILAFAKTLPASLHIHPLGIDGAVNDAMLLKLANHSHGRCVFIHPNDSIIEAVLAVVNAIEEPVVTGLSLRAPWQVVGSSPKALPRRGETSTLLSSPELNAPVQWNGTLANGRAWSPQVSHYTSHSPALVLLRVRREIEALQSAGDRTSAIALAKRFNLLCAGTCFIAVDRSTKGQVAQRQVYQPSLEEAGFGSADMMRSGVRMAKKCMSAPAAAPMPAQACEAEMADINLGAPAGGAVRERAPAQTLLEWLTELRSVETNPLVRQFLDAFIAIISALPAYRSLKLYPSCAKVRATTESVISGLLRNKSVGPDTLDELIKQLSLVTPKRTDPTVFEPLRAALVSVLAPARAAKPSAATRS